MLYSLARSRFHQPILTLEFGSSVSELGRWTNHCIYLPIIHFCKAWNFRHFSGLLDTHSCIPPAGRLTPGMLWENADRSSVYTDLSAVLTSQAFNAIRRYPLPLPKTSATSSWREKTGWVLKRYRTEFWRVGWLLSKILKWNWKWYPSQKMYKSCFQKWEIWKNKQTNMVCGDLNEKYSP